MYIIGSSLFFILFSLFPLDNFNKFAKMIIRHITNFTAGIYMLHIKIFEIFERRIDSIKKHTFLGCIIIYLLSYLTCLIFYSLFKRSKIKYLFI
jgi:peptidoglycan/LPS O-acetylase OafA/YrhL